MVVLGLKSLSLVFLGKLCDDRCIIGLNSKRLLAVKTKSSIRGETKLKHGLWNIPLQRIRINTFKHFKTLKHAGMYKAWNTECTIAHKVHTLTHNNSSKTLSDFHINSLKNDILN